MAKYTDPNQNLNLSSAERRLLRMLVIEEARLAPLSIKYVGDDVGHGVFATAKIRSGDLIGEYTGVLRIARPEDVSNRYLAQTEAYGPLSMFFIDGQSEGNLTRFINHGTTSANVSNEHVFHQKRWHRVLRADRDIAAGEQILWDYGTDYWRGRTPPLDL